MTIQKLGHCCLAIKHNGKTILTDPGEWSNGADKLQGVDLVLISHEHFDHLDPALLMKVMENNPGAIVVTNSLVGKVLTDNHIPFQVIEDSAPTHVHGVSIQPFTSEHQPVYEGAPAVLNSSYLIGERLFFPGDSFTSPDVEVDILALPVAGPWLTMGQSLDYAVAIKPRFAIPVHDGMLKTVDWLYKHPQRVLSQSNIQFVGLKPGEEAEM